MIFLTSLLALGLVAGLFDLFDSSSNDDDGMPPAQGLTGTDGNDTLMAESGDVRALGGDDLLTISGTATGYGDQGNDTLTGGGDIVMYGGAGADDIRSQDDGRGYGGDGNDSMVGAGNGVFYGEDGDDTLTGDTFFDGGGELTLFGGIGDDVLVAGNEYTNLTNFGAAPTNAYGGIGNDDITLRGESHGFGGAGDDTFTLLAESTATGGVGADTFTVEQNSQGNPDDPTRAPADPITITDFVLGTDRLQIDMAANEDGVTMVETANGTTITVPWANAGTLGANDPTEVVIELRGVTGMTLNDLEFLGGAPDSTLNGTAGNDTLTSEGEVSYDLFYGLGGDDSLLLTGSTEGFGGAGNDSMQVTGSAVGFGDAGNDVLGGNESATLFGGAGDDRLGADSFADSGASSAPLTLDGGDGNDTLSAGHEFTDNIGSDAFAEVSGGNGDDLIVLRGVSEAFGGAGDDTFGLKSESIATGGDGDDTFVVLQNINANPGDNDPGDPEPIRLTDFVQGSDRLQIDMAANAAAVTITETAAGTTIRVPWLKSTLLSDNDPSEVVIQLAGVKGLTLSDLEFVDGNEAVAA